MVLSFYIMFRICGLSLLVMCVSNSYIEKWLYAMALCLHHHCEQDDPLDPIIICRQSCSRTFVTDTASSIAILGFIILNLFTNRCIWLPQRLHERPWPSYDHVRASITSGTHKGCRPLATFLTTLIGRLPRNQASFSLTLSYILTSSANEFRFI